MECVISISPQVKGVFEVFEGMAYVLQCKAALIKGVPQPLHSQHGLVLARHLHLPLLPSTHKGICPFFWPWLLVKPCSPPILKLISPCDNSISISQRVNYICWWNKEKSRLKEKVSIISYSQRRDFTTGDRHLILFAPPFQRNLFLSAQSAWLSFQTEF